MRQNRPVPSRSAGAAKRPGLVGAACSPASAPFVALLLPSSWFGAPSIGRAGDLFGRGRRALPAARRV